MKIQHLKVIAFDADDTLWVNEPYFQETERAFCALLEDYLPAHSVGRELLTTEIANIPLFGYGIKSFILSMIETAVRVSEGTISASGIAKIIELGKAQYAQPVDVLPGVEAVLQALQGRYRLVVATKGDLLDQERKLQLSGLAGYFHHVEVVSEKQTEEYRKLIKHLDVSPDAFMMVGNSLKSDILPVLDLGGYGVHIPFHTTWALEHVEGNIAHERCFQLKHIEEVLSLI